LAPLPPRRPPPGSTPFPYTTLFRSGSRGTAGEIGHIPIDPNGPDCPCGQRGCIEVLASGSAISRQWPVSHGSPVQNLFEAAERGDRKSTRLNSSHVKISYAVFCLKK